MPKNRQHCRKIKYPDKVTKQKRLVFVRILLFSSSGSRNAYFPTAHFGYFILLFRIVVKIRCLAIKNHLCLII